jgi:hypothetical protein
VAVVTFAPVAVRVGGMVAGVLAWGREGTPMVDHLPSELVPLLEAACAAPSTYNAQPWHLRVTAASRIEVWADRSRRLPVHDPHDRELTIGCGALIANLALAAAGQGLELQVSLLPGPTPELLAVTSLGPGPEVVGSADLLGAIDRRRTVRRPFLTRPLIDDVVEAVLDSAGPGTSVRVVTGERQREVAELVAEGDRLLFREPVWRRELAGWLRPPWAVDGLPVPAGTVLAARAVVAGADLGRRTARADAELVRQAPAVVVVASDEDRPVDWLAAGATMQRVLLGAARFAAQAGFVCQACHVPALRSRLRDLVGLEGHPQVVLRLGYPEYLGRRRPRAVLGVRRRPSSGVRRRRRALSEVVVVDIGGREAAAG